LLHSNWAVPLWAESRGHTTWHPAHIAERYGLFTIIVLGESILSATVAVQQALASGERFAALAPVIVGGLLTVYAMWWLYFYRPFEVVHTERQRFAFVWGYGHLFVFTSAAAVGAGLAVVVDAITHKAHISDAAAGAAVAVPVAIYVLSLCVLHYRSSQALSLVLSVITALMVLLTPIVFGTRAVPATGVLMALLLATKITRYYRSGAESAAA
jgi:low temperature requirement protein LtrA